MVDSKEASVIPLDERLRARVRTLCDDFSPTRAIRTFLGARRIT